MARWKQTAQAQNWPMPRLRGKGGGTGGREERDERIRGGCRTTMHCMYARHILSVADRPHYQLTQRRRRILSDIADDASLHTLPVELARLAPRCALLLKFVELVRVVLRSLNLLLQNYCACARLREAALFHRPILGSSCWRRRAGAAAHAMIDRYLTNPPSLRPSSCFPRLLTANRPRSVSLPGSRKLRGWPGALTLSVGRTFAASSLATVRNTALLCTAVLRKSTYRCQCVPVRTPPDAIDYSRQAVVGASQRSGRPVSVRKSKKHSCAAPQDCRILLVQCIREYIPCTQGTTVL